jgi:hypothetical protein
VPDASYDFVSRNQGFIRSLPLWAGGVGFVSLLANRTLSGVSATTYGFGCSFGFDIACVLASSSSSSSYLIAVPGWCVDSQLLPAATSTQQSVCSRGNAGLTAAAPQCLLPPIQIAPIVDAGSSQSRADVLGILLSAVLLLTGLQWLALKPKPIDAVS